MKARWPHSVHIPLKGLTTAPHLRQGMETMLARFSPSPNLPHLPHCVQA
jgi:hypothetical protein